MTKTKRYPSAREILKFAKKLETIVPGYIRYHVEETADSYVVFIVKKADGTFTSVQLDR